VVIGKVGHMYVVLVYDISQEDNGTKVLNQVFKICKKYLHHIQNSVFEGEMSESQVLSLKTELGARIRKEFDSVIIFKSRDQRWMEKSIWGKRTDDTSNII